MIEEHKKYHEIEADVEEITEIVKKKEYDKKQLQVLKVNLLDWHDGQLDSATGLANAGIMNSENSIDVLNPTEACSHGRP